MGRVRFLKPGFFTNEALGELPPITRILFAGLWCLADREGRLEDRPKRIKAEVLPYDDADVDLLLVQLEEAGFVERYTVDGRDYLAVVNFVKHQHPHHKEVPSTYPAQPSLAASMQQARAKLDASLPQTRPEYDANLQQTRRKVEPSTAQARARSGTTTSDNKQEEVRIEVPVELASSLPQAQAEHDSSSAQARPDLASTIPTQSVSYSYSPLVQSMLAPEGALTDPVPDPVTPDHSKPAPVGAVAPLASWDPVGTGPPATSRFANRRDPRRARETRSPTDAGTPPQPDQPTGTTKQASPPAKGGMINDHQFQESDGVIWDVEPGTGRLILPQGERGHRSLPPASQTAP